jgi:hypothetical protein
MTHFKIGSINKNFNIEILLRIFLLKVHTKFNHQLKLLSFSIPLADNKMIKALQTMINDLKKRDYTFKRVMDNIILQWK